MFVSGGEIRLALKAGFKGKNIVFSGVGKTKPEIQLAFEKRIFFKSMWKANQN